jgi:hypothetical protein
MLQFISETVVLCEVTACRVTDRWTTSSILMEAAHSSQKITISICTHAKISDFVWCKTSARTTSMKWVSLNGEPTHSEEQRCKSEHEQRQRGMIRYIKMQFWSSIPTQGWRKGKLEHQVLARISFRSPTLHHQVVYWGYGKSLLPQLVPGYKGRGQQTPDDQNNGQTTTIKPHKARFETLTVMKRTIFLDITPCSLLKVNRRFGGTYHLHLQGRRICQARYQRESRWQAELFSLKRHLTFNRLHSVISQMTILFKPHEVHHDDAKKLL